MLFAYLGPETTLPLASFLAGAVGFVLMFWRQMKRVAIAWLCKVVPGLKKDARPVIARASRTLKNIEGAWVQDQKVVVKNGKVAEYRVAMKVTFILEK